jgi:haloalkane dehalogenase
MILEQNLFVEGVLPRSVLRKLGDEEMAAYRRPFLERESRLPTLVWPRQIPIDGEPADVTAIAESYGKAMSQSAIPKLLIVGEPGAIVKGRTLAFCRTWPNQTEVTVKGVHFLQEDSPHEIGNALQKFMKFA